MELLTILPRLDLNQLLYICQRDQIPISSPSQKFMLRADIERAVYERNPQLRGQRPPSGLFISPEMLEIPYQYRNSATSDKSPLLTHSILLELGVDEVGVTPENFGPWAQEVGLPWDYLSHDFTTVRTVLAVYLWERQLPAPDQFLNKSFSANCYSMRLDIFRSKSQNMFSDETIEEYIYRTGFQSYTPLVFQDLPTLIYLADSVSGYLQDKTLYFKTKVGCIDYLLNVILKNSTVKDWIEQFLIAKNMYPERQTLVRDYFNKELGMRVFYGLRYSLKEELGDPVKALSRILSFPACRAEEFYLRNFRGNVQETFHILSQEYQTKMDYIDSIFRFNPIDLNLRTTRPELVEIIRSNTKKWGQLSGTAIQEACGWVGLFRDIKHEMMIRIKEDLRNSCFELITDGRICSNQITSLMEPTSEIPLLIAYGRFENPVGYSVDELEHAFIVTDDYVEFPKPENPRLSFSRKEIEQLYEELRTTNSTNFPGFTRDLETKIRRGLMHQEGLNTYRDQLQHLSPEDLEIFRGIFQNLFQAGMFQRRWCGTGPYPMKYYETGGGNQSEISAAMTPPLNNVRDLRELLSPEGLRVFQDLPSLDFAEHHLTIRERKLDDLIDRTVAGNYCVAFVSSLFIYSSYGYLEMLGDAIPGFDVEEFQSESTHR